ncbi:MAG: hypothetical protein LUD19_02365, partial [Clostridia bacterium]|nr:hypothetical protein [Clostridia bacterium]
LMCFTAVEYPDDPNVVGNRYWYACRFETAEVGDKVIAPLGRHNNLQTGIIREVRWADDFDAPYPLHLIKNVRELIKADKEL